MTTRPSIAAQKRVISGKAVAKLRHQGILPAVVYGHNKPSESIQLDARAFDTLRRTAGRNALVDLSIDGGRAHPVLVHAVQEHPIKRVPQHVDFYLVTMTEEIHADVPLVAVGASFAVDKMSGTLLQTVDHLRVRALPDHLPQSIEFDISVLDTFDAAIRVRDLKIPAGVTLLTDADEPVAHVQPSRAEVAEEAEKAAEEGEEAAAPEAAEPES